MAHGSVALLPHMIFLAQFYKSKLLCCDIVGVTESPSMSKRFWMFWLQLSVQFKSPRLPKGADSQTPVRLAQTPRSAQQSQDRAFPACMVSLLHSGLCSQPRAPLSPELQIVTSRAHTRLVLDGQHCLLAPLPRCSSPSSCCALEDDPIDSPTDWF